MTEKQAYAAMYFFLNEFWKRTKSDDLGNILGDMSLLADGSTADPAIREDWNRAVECALQGNEPDSLTFS